MRLNQILNGVDFKCENFVDAEILDIAYDSRKAEKDVVFVSLIGVHSDGHDYVQKAYENGCRFFVCEKTVKLADDAVVIMVENTRSVLATMSCNFFENPSKELCVIGITGTKGKTTIANLMKFVFESAGIKCGVIGTIGAWYADVEIPTVNTTPESYELQKILRTMLDGGCKVAAIEVSSLGLKHHRVQGTRFAYGVFSNLYPDHIGTNEHESMQEYSYWKAQLFKMCDKAIVNIDDEFSGTIIENCNCDVITYGLDEDADYQLVRSEITQNEHYLGTKFETLYDKKLHEYVISLIGEVNALNALVAIAITHDYNISDEQVRVGLEKVSIKGRSELIKLDDDIFIVIDYAHNGVSLQTLIETLKQYKHKRLVTLVGSVGSRTECRREEIGLVTGKMSDFSIITSDDPDFEDPDKIINEITAFIDTVGGKYIKIADRAKAIEYAVKNAEHGDIIIFAGKGHEQYMKIEGKKVPFSEHEEIKKALEQK